MSRADKKTYRERLAEIEPHWQPGMSTPELAAAMGVSRMTLWEIFRDHRRLAQKFPLIVRQPWHNRDMSQLAPDVRATFETAAKAGLSMSQISAESGVSVAQLSKWASGQVTPRATTLERVGLAVAELMREKDSVRG